MAALLAMSFTMDATPYPGWNLLTDCEYEFVSYLPQLDCDDREVVLDVDGAVVVTPQCSSSTVFCYYWVIANRMKGVFMEKQPWRINLVDSNINEIIE